MSLDTNALVTLADQKTFLQIAGTDTSLDVILELLINSISSLFDKFTGRNLREATYATFYLDGNGKSRLWLPNYPVASIGTVTEDDVALTEGTTHDYIFYTTNDYAFLQKVTGLWTTAAKGVKLTAYKAGFKLKNMINFDSGSTEPAVGATLVGATSAATGLITKIIVTSGAWGSDTAAGSVEFSTVTGTFVNNETVNISGGASNVMTVDQAETPTLIPTDLQLACFKQVAWEWKKYSGKRWGESSHSFEGGSISIETVNLLPDVKEILNLYRRLSL